MALQVRFDPNVVISHCAAAYLWQFESVAPRLEVTLSRSHKPVEGVIVHRTRDFLGTPGFRGPFRVLNPTCVLLQLAGVLDEETLEIALEFALRRELTSVSKVEDLLGKVGRGFRGVAALKMLLAFRSASQAPTGSIFFARPGSPLRSPSSRSPQMIGRTFSTSPIRR